MKNEYTGKLEKLLRTVCVRLASIHGEVAISNTPMSLLMVKAQSKNGIKFRLASNADNVTQTAWVAVTVSY